VPDMDKHFDIVALGEAMVEFNQTGAEDGRTYLQGFGGDTSNAVIAASRQGVRCAYITRLGDDDFGRLCLNLWRTERVDARGVAIDADAPTGVYFVRHDESGHSFSYLRVGSAASRMRTEDLPTSLLQNTKLLHVSGISQAISASARHAVIRAVEIARAAGAAIAYDPNLRLKLWSKAEASVTIEATIPLCDHFLPSLDDLQSISGLTEPRDVVAWCHGQGAKVVVLKLGRGGVLVSASGRCVDIGAHDVDAIDATGAGDCFDGSYLGCIAAGADPVSAARWANAAAALATTGYGAVDPLPRPAQIRRLLEGR